MICSLPLEEYPSMRPTSEKGLHLTFAHRTNKIRGYSLATALSQNAYIDHCTLDYSTITRC